MPKIPTKYRVEKEETIWEQRSITLTPLMNDKDNPRGKKTISAYVYGGLAVHLYCFDYEHSKGKYVVTHIKSGYRVCIFNTEEDAMVAAEELWDKYERVFRWTTVDEVRKEAPKKLDEWCTKMCKTFKYHKEPE